MRIFKRCIYAVLACGMLSSTVSYADCPSGFDDILGSTVYGRSNVKIDWVGKKAVTKNGVVSAAGSLCFSADGIKCINEELSVVLNTGSETEVFRSYGKPDQEVSVCMRSCSRTKEVQMNSDESPDWHDIINCKDEFKATAE